MHGSIVLQACKGIRSADPFATLCSSERCSVEYHHVGQFDHDPEYQFESALRKLYTRDQRK